MPKANTPDSVHTTSRRQLTLVPPVVTLAVWRLQTSWRLVIIAGVGVLAAVVLVCTVPLFSDVATSAGLHRVLPADPAQRSLQIDVRMDGAAIAHTADVASRVDLLVRQDLPAFTIGPAQFAMTSHPITILPNAGPSLGTLALTGFPEAALSERAYVVQGRLPRAKAAEVEVLVTQATANALALRVGTGFLLGSPLQDRTRGVHLRVVGIFTALQPSADPGYGPQTESGEAGSAPPIYSAIATSEAIIGSGASWEHAVISQQPGTTGAEWDLYWTYPVAIPQLSVRNLDRLTNQTRALDSDIYYGLTSIGGVQAATYHSAIFDALSQNSQRRGFAELPVWILLIQVVGLVLLFLGLVAQLVIDDQATAIATLRSRGASRLQLLGAFAVQSIVIGLLALVIGPPIAAGIVRLIAGMLLPPQDVGAIASLPLDPQQLIIRVGWLAGLAAVAAASAMVAAIWRASGLNILALRQDATRAQRSPLWQRLYLDVLAALLAIAGYADFALDSSVKASFTLLALVAPLCLLLAGGLLALRTFPVILRAGAWAASRMPGAPLMLALTQLGRSPRQAVRITLLLAMTVAFAVFTVTASATASQRIIDLAAYQAVADFGGGLLPSPPNRDASLSTVTATYQRIPGVVTVSPGYRAVASLGGSGQGMNGTALQIIAVDAATFAHTAIWTTHESTQPLGELMSHLVLRQSDLRMGDKVPVILDAAGSSALHISAGGSFSLPLPGNNGKHLQCVAVAVVAHIPSVYDVGDVGVLVDYSTYATALARDLDIIVQPNFVWLRTQGDPASISSVRAALQVSPLQLVPLTLLGDTTIPATDRRSVITAMQSDPLQINFTGSLGFGAATALLLALLGTLIAAWRQARDRIVTVAVLRALGTEPRQVGQLLLWEQGIVYATSLCLGAVLGLLLAIVAIPALPTLIFTNDLAGSFYSGSTIFVAQPLHIIVPLHTLGFLFGGLVLMCGSALVFSVRIVSRPERQQTLRLDED